MSVIGEQSGADNNSLRGEDVRGYVEYLRDLGVFDLYAVGDGRDTAAAEWLASVAPVAAIPPAKAAISRPVTAAAPAQTRPVPFTPSPARGAAQRGGVGPEIRINAPAAAPAVPLEGVPVYQEREDAPAAFAPPSMPLISFNARAPLPAERVASADRAAALLALRQEIGDCTRCPLAYAGRHTIVFADGTPQAELMFVGEGPGADEDASGVPFVGKAGQLLNNMIGAMGLKREEVYIANIVMCRPPKNRAPEPKEADTCSQFLLRQIDIVQPKVIVALGATAATYLLGVKQPLTALRGQWHDVRGAKCAVTYHPAFLLRDPRQKAEAWKDLQRVMVELNLKPPAKA